MNWRVAGLTPIIYFEDKPCDPSTKTSKYDCRELLLRNYRMFGFVHPNAVELTVGNKTLFNTWIKSNPVFTLCFRINRGAIKGNDGDIKFNSSDQLTQFITEFRHTVKPLVNEAKMLMRVLHTARDCRKIEEVFVDRLEDDVTNAMVKMGIYSGAPIPSGMELSSDKEVYYTANHCFACEDENSCIAKISKAKSGTHRYDIYFEKQPASSVVAKTLSIAANKISNSCDNIYIDIPIFSLDLRKMHKLTEYQLHTVMGALRNVLVLLVGDVVLSDSSMGDINEKLSYEHFYENMRKMLYGISERMGQSYKGSLTRISMDTSGLSYSEYMDQAVSGKVIAGFLDKEHKSSVHALYTSNHTSCLRFAHYMKKFKSSTHTDLKRGLS